MVTSVSLRPQVNLAYHPVKEAVTRNCREQLNNVQKAVRNHQISDLGAMAQKMQLNTQIQAAKVPPVRYIEEIKPQNLQAAAKTSDVGSLTKPKTITDVIRRFHNGAQPSKHEQSQVLANQMDMFAANNMVLHGLI